VSGVSDSESLAVEQVLDELARAASPDDTAAAPPEDEVAEVLERLYLEVLGLVGASVEPLEPPAGARAALLARLGGDETQEVEPVAAPVSEPTSEPVRDGAPAAAAEPTAPPAPEPAAAPPVTQRRAASAPERSRGAARPARRRGLGLLAALLALLALGAGAAAAYFYSELESAAARLRRLERERGEAVDRGKAEAAALAESLAELERHHEFVTAPAVTVFALRPPGGAPQPLARGALWLAPDRQRWLLDLRGLAPAPPGRDYQLWFLLEGASRPAGVVPVAAGGGAILESSGFPATATGVALTLERAGGAALASGPPILLGTSPVRL
jgi:hypothetical protein